MYKSIHLLAKKRRKKKRINIYKYIHSEVGSERWCVGGGGEGAAYKKKKYRNKKRMVIISQCTHDQSTMTLKQCDKPG